MDIECRLLFPPGFDAAARYPLVVDIHGGPHGAFYDTFEPAQQVVATAGYLVLLVNPRGSSTYGADFTVAVQEDWGGEDYQDIMAAGRRPLRPALRRLGQAGRPRLQLRRLHDQLGRGPHHPLQGRGRGRALHQPQQHVRHLRHRRQLR